MSELQWLFSWLVFWVLVVFLLIMALPHRSHADILTPDDPGSVQRDETKQDCPAIALPCGDGVHSTHMFYCESQKKCLWQDCPSVPTYRTDAEKCDQVLGDTEDKL